VCVFAGGGGRGGRCGALYPHTLAGSVCVGGIHAAPHTQRERLPPPQRTPKGATCYTTAGSVLTAPAQTHSTLPPPPLLRSAVGGRRLADRVFDGARAPAASQAEEGPLLAVSIPFLRRRPPTRNGPSAAARRTLPCLRPFLWRVLI
jgi:hypothetical protein